MTPTSIPQQPPKRKVTYYASEFTHVCVPTDVSKWEQPTYEKRIKGSVFVGHSDINWAQDAIYCPSCGNYLPQTEAELARAKGGQS